MRNRFSISYRNTAQTPCTADISKCLIETGNCAGRERGAVVKAVDTPVTLKIRTGWAPESRNAVRVAKIAEESGVRLLAIHGRTRACGYAGHAEYETIREVKRATRLPVVANGDITTPEDARRVLQPELKAR